MKKENKPIISRNHLQSLIWLIGIGILFITNDWWPGILLVIASSLLAEFVLQRVFPGSRD